MFYAALLCLSVCLVGWLLATHVKLLSGCLKMKWLNFGSRPPLHLHLELLKYSSTLRYRPFLQFGLYNICKKADRTSIKMLSETCLRTLNFGRHLEVIWIRSLDPESEWRGFPATSQVEDEPRRWLTGYAGYEWGQEETVAIIQAAADKCRNEGMSI